MCTEVYLIGVEIHVCASPISSQNIIVCVFVYVSLPVCGLLEGPFVHYLFLVKILLCVCVCVCV